MSTDLHIVVIIDRYLPIIGGAQNNVHELCCRLSRDGYRINIITRRIYKWMKCDEELDRVKIKRVGYFPARVISKLLCFSYIFIYLINKRNEYDVILSVPCAEVTDLLPAYLSSILTKKPYVIRLTGFPAFDVKPSSAKGTIWTRFMEILLPKRYWLKIMRRAAAVVAQSSVLREVIDGYGVERCEVISNGVDFARFHVPDELEKNRLRSEYKLPEDKVIIINTGRYEHSKNQITLIKAAEYIENSIMPGKLYVLILGGTQRNQWTSNEDEIKHYVNNNGLDSFIRFFDDADDVENYLKAADIFCLPTVVEGMSNALIEAMACGLPITCSDIPEVLCMFPEGEGMFHDPHDIDSLVNHLTALIASEELRIRYGSMLAEYAHEKYSNVILSEMYADLFRDIIKDSRAVSAY